MKIPAKIKEYCKKCKRHTEHNLKEFKTRSARKSSKGTRRHDVHVKGYGGKYQAIATVKKKNKRPTFMAECTVCGAKHYFVIPKRMKKPDIVK